MNAHTVVLGPILREPGGFMYELTEGDRGPENRWWAHIDTQHGNLSDEDRERLVDLFAAAPQMLEALRAVAALTDDRAAFVMEGPRAFARVERVVAAAIAAAEGKATP